MKLANYLLLNLSNITKIISKIGTGRFYRLLLSVMIKLGVRRLFFKVMFKLGANPIVTAKMKDKTAILVDLRTKTEFSSFFTGEYDSDLISVIRHLLKPDYTFLDIGANIGFYSVAIGAFIKSKESAGQVIAFEPMDNNFNRLLENLKLNNLGSYCLAYNIGLSNQTVESQIVLREDFLDGSDTGNCSISINEKIDFGLTKKPIKLERLDKFWKELKVEQKIDIIKMDIEGHEDFCLQGGQQVLKEHRPTILMEVNKPYYFARGVKLDECFFPLIPERYSIYHQSNAKWVRIDSFNDCNNIDNVFLIPNERLTIHSFKIFN